LTESVDGNAATLRESVENYIRIASEIDSMHQSIDDLERRHLQLANPLNVTFSRCQFIVSSKRQCVLMIITIFAWLDGSRYSIFRLQDNVGDFESLTPSGLITAFSPSVSLQFDNCVFQGNYFAGNGNNVSSGIGKNGISQAVSGSNACLLLLLTCFSPSPKDMLYIRGVPWIFTPHVLSTTTSFEMRQ
jgi:hypothetical protein